MTPSQRPAGGQPQPVSSRSGAGRSRSRKGAEQAEAAPGGSAPADPPPDTDPLLTYFRNVSEQAAMVANELERAEAASSEGAERETLAEKADGLAGAPSEARVETSPGALGASAGRGSVPPGPSEPRSSDGEFTPEQDRLDVQLFVGQLHGLLDDLARRMPPDVVLSDEDREALELAYREASAEFGRLHAELNTGDHDEQLADNGLSGRQLAQKLRRWGRAAKRFVRDRTGDNAQRALRAAGVVMGTAAAMVGAAEPIKELVETFAEVLADTLEDDGGGTVEQPRARRRA